MSQSNLHSQCNLYMDTQTTNLLEHNSSHLRLAPLCRKKGSLQVQPVEIIYWWDNWASSNYWCSFPKWVNIIYCKKVESVQNFQMGLIILVRNSDNDGENPKWTNLTGKGLLISLELGFFLDQHLGGKRKKQNKTIHPGSLNLTYETKAPPSGEKGKTTAFAQILLFKPNRCMFSWISGLSVSTEFTNFPFKFVLKINRRLRKKEQTTTSFIIS